MPSSRAGEEHLQQAAKHHPQARPDRKWQIDVEALDDKDGEAAWTGSSKLLLVAAVFKLAARAC